MMILLRQYIVCIIVGLSPGILEASESVLRFYNWNDYVAPDTISNFEKETGITVVYEEFDSNELLEQRLLSGDHDFDLVVPSGDFLGRQIAAGLFQTLDREKLTNFKNLDAEFLSTMNSNDPGNKYSVPYLWGTTGIGFNATKVRNILGSDYKLDSWSVFFVPSIMEKLSECGVSFLDTPSEIFPAALNYLGMSPENYTASELKGAVAGMLDNVRSYVKYFHSSDYITDLANGDVCLSVGWSGDVIQAAQRAKDSSKSFDIEYVIPKEGAAVWVDLLAIPKSASNVDNAHKFINYILRPKVIAEITNFVSYANANAASLPYVSHEVLNNEGIYPSEKVRSRLFVIEPVPTVLAKVMERRWRQLKARGRAR